MSKAIFFDLGGTLFSYRNLARTTLPLLIEAARRLDTNADASTLKRAYNEASERVSQQYAEKAYYLHRDFFDDNFSAFVDILGARRDESVHDWYRDAHREAIIDCLVLKEDCIDTLRYLRERDLYLSVVSNIDDDMLVPLVEREGLDAYFDHWTSSEAAQSCKPDPRFFEHALELSGHEPADVLFVGDSPEHDIAGAKAAGMRTALIVDGGMPPPLQTGRNTADPDHVIERLSELRLVLA